MMFACCHPAIPAESQLVLMLRTLCGLSVRELAVAFLLPEETIAKRLYRAKEKIRQENLSLEVPSGAELSPRLDAVLQAVYLLFNEGYKSASEASVIRRDLCEEALRLGDLLCRHPAGDLPKTHALQALRDIPRKLRQAEGGTVVYEVEPELALYLLNHKRDSLSNLEDLYNATLEIRLAGI